MKKDTVSIPVDLTDEEFLFLAKEAHEQNITINQLAANLFAQEIFKGYQTLLEKLLEVELGNECQTTCKKKPSPRRGSKCKVPGRTSPITKASRKRRTR